MIIQSEKGTRNVNDLFLKRREKGSICSTVSSFRISSLRERRMMCLFGCAAGMNGQSMRLYRRLGR